MTATRMSAADPMICDHERAGSAAPAAASAVDLMKLRRSIVVMFRGWVEFVQIKNEILEGNHAASCSDEQARVSRTQTARSAHGRARPPFCRRTAVCGGRARLPETRRAPKGVGRDARVFPGGSA